MGTYAKPDKNRSLQMECIRRGFFAVYEDYQQKGHVKFGEIRPGYGMPYGMQVLQCAQAINNLQDPRLSPRWLQDLGTHMADLLYRD
ncbi:MAG: hypothetical protein ACYTAN_15780, partial [Planctomycetota bacterium]